ncbi:MAG: rhodanese-related sulfurtransferase [Chloroflexota bacterium]|nr:rhodanese-related sulfurtransferase [Chloroflexota bacterium]
MTDLIQHENNHATMYTVASLYHFTRLTNLREKQEQLRSLCKSLDILGTLLLAEEGLNGTISGQREAIASVLDQLCVWPEIGDLQVKYSESADQSFKRLKVKIKKEIVTMGKPEVDVVRDAGQYVKPSDWNALISRDDVLVVDTRNTYEFGIGHFPNAIEPETESFVDFPAWADQLSQERERPTAVAMYCTGGIRCEKATAYMRELGFDEVYHLQGGILKYLEEVPEEESLWEGECFVFDGRVSLKHNLIEGTYELCYACQQPISTKESSSPLFERGVSCPKCVDRVSEEKKQRFRERHRQVLLSTRRGEQHIGDKAMVRKRSLRQGG